MNKKETKIYLLYFSWVVALSATLGSLYFSEIAKFTPCILCWYQRIFIYPLVFIIATGIIKKDKSLSTYVLPLSISGGLISIYHNLYYYHLIPESVAPCIQGVSCATRYFAWFGFITIPLLSLIAFSLITISMLIIRHYEQRI